MYGGKFAFQKLTELACSEKEIYHFFFTLYSRANSKYKPPGGLYSEGRFRTEGFLRYDFGELIFGGAFFRNFRVFLLKIQEAISYKTKQVTMCEKPICMRWTVKKLARESVGKAHAKNMRIIIPGKEPFFTKWTCRKRTCMRERIMRDISLIFNEFRVAPLWLFMHVRLLWMIN